MNWDPSPTPNSFDLFLFNIINVMIGSDWLKLKTNKYLLFKVLHSTLFWPCGSLMLDQYCLCHN